MKNVSLLISEDFLERVCPFFLVWNDRGELVRVSASLKEVWRVEDASEILLDKLRVRRPFEGTLSPQLIPELTNVVVHLCYEGFEQVELRGQFLLDRSVWFFVGAPIVDRLIDLEKMGMRLSDLPLHDASGNLLIANEFGRILLDEAGKRTVELEAAVKKNEALISELREAIKEIKTLRGIIPICSYCHQIRDDEGAWTRIEAYLGTHSDVQLSHGICPECFDIEIKKIPDEPGSDQDPSQS